MSFCELVKVYANSHYVVTPKPHAAAGDQGDQIGAEATDSDGTLSWQNQGKLLEAQRLVAADAVRHGDDSRGDGFMRMALRIIRGI